MTLALLMPAWFKALVVILAIIGFACAVALIVGTVYLALSNAFERQREARRRARYGGYVFPVDRQETRERLPE